MLGVSELHYSTRRQILDGVLQLMHCATLLSSVQVFLKSVSRSLEVNLEQSIALIEESVKFQIKLEYF